MCARERERDNGAPPSLIACAKRDAFLSFPLSSPTLTSPSAENPKMFISSHPLPLPPPPLHRPTRKISSPPEATPLFFNSFSFVLAPSASSLPLQRHIITFINTLHIKALTHSHTLSLSFLISLFLSIHLHASLSTHFTHPTLSVFFLSLCLLHCSSFRFFFPLRFTVASQNPLSTSDLYTPTHTHTDTK